MKRSRIRAYRAYFNSVLSRLFRPKKLFAQGTGRYEKIAGHLKHIEHAQVRKKIV